MRGTMAFYKSTLIDNYFKPFAKSSQTKRPPPEDTPGQPPAKRKSPLGSPGQSQGVNQNECAETLDTIENFSLHSASRHQSSPAISKPAEPKPTIPTPLQDDTAAPTASINTTPIHPSSDTGSQKIAVPGSQSLLTSSQRIVRNGEVRIRDSDEDSNSDTSLEDLNELLAMHEPARGASPPSEPELPHPRPADDADSSTTKRKKRGRNSARQTDSPLPSALPVIPKIYKISLESLAKQRKQYDASKDCVAQAKSILDRYDQQKASTGEKSRPSERTGGLEADLINVVMKNHGDEDDIGRLKTAIHRTEALQHGKSWSFFEDYPEELSSEQDDFPILSSDHRLKPILSGRSSRQQAFLSGYIGEYAKRESLPEEIMLWLMDAVCHEPRDDLRHSYTATLNAADELYSLLTPERIDTLFQKLGATAMAVDVEKKLVPRAIISQSTEVVLRPNLLSILELLQRVASDLRPESRKHLLYTLCRLSLDNSVATNYHAIRAIENAFAGLANSISEECLEDEVSYEVLRKGITC